MRPPQPVDPIRGGSPPLICNATRCLGWMAWHEPLGEWTLRAAGGFTRTRQLRATPSAIRAFRSRQAAEQIIAFAAAHVIAPMAQVIEGSPEEQALRDLGWASTYQPAAVLVSRLAEFLRRPAC